MRLKIKERKSNDTKINGQEQNRETNKGQKSKKNLEIGLARNFNFISVD